MPVCDVYDLQGKKVDELKLPEGIFDSVVNVHALHQAIMMYQANLRQGNASTKERAEVSGGGKKPWRQKGTGRARAGSSRSPLWHGGGTTFGPHPKDFTYQVPRKVKIAALGASLNSKFKENDLCCVEQLKTSSDKTKDFVKILKNLKLTGKIVAVVESIDEKVFRVSRNIASLRMVRSCDVTAHDILQNKKLLITKSAFKDLLKRIQ